MDALGSYEPLPHGSELLSYWIGELGNSGASRMLQTLASKYPSAISASEMAEEIGMAESGTFGTYLGKLRSLELVTGSRSAIRASDELFD